MSDLISRDFIQKCRGVVLTQEVIDAMPTVDAVPVVHGHWFKIGESCYRDILECSVCHTQYTGFAKNYCGDCGAKMNGVID